MAIQSVSGSTIAIATTSGVATVDLAGFGAKTYTTIGQVQNIGDFGLVYNEIKFQNISTRLTLKFRGSVDAGNQTLELGYDATDAGQTQLRAAFGTDTSWAIRLTLQDGSIFYYTVKVMQAPFKLGASDSITMTSAVLAIDSYIIS